VFNERHFRSIGVTELAWSPFNTGDGKPAELAEPAGWVETVTAATSVSEELFDRKCRSLERPAAATAMRGSSVRNLGPISFTRPQHIVAQP
jgi:hypothetical protein